jgi:hypothetical protein
MIKGEADLENGPVAVDPRTVDGEKVVRDAETGSSQPARLKDRILGALVVGNVEIRGVMPVPVEERTQTNYFNYFTIWACMNVNLLP